MLKSNTQPTGGAGGGETNILMDDRWPSNVSDYTRQRHLSSKPDQKNSEITLTSSITETVLVARDSLLLARDSLLVAKGSEDSAEVAKDCSEGAKGVEDKGPGSLLSN